MNRLLPSLLLLSVAACHCGGNNPITTEECTDVANACTPDGGECGSGEACEALSATIAADAGLTGAGCFACASTNRSCTANNQCCPGQVCSTAVSVCLDCYDLTSGACGESDCTTDAQCAASQGPGHICAFFGSDGGPTIAGEAPSRRCSYPTCTTTADCTGGGTCFAGYCVLSPPCGGTCASGTACAVTDDFCSAVPPSVSSCQQSCGPGSLLIFTNQTVPTGIYNDCDLPSVTCTCQTFPPVTSSQIGEWSSLAANATDIWVSAYDRQFGDLVAYHFAIDGGLIDLEYVDGLPDSGAIVGDPNGPRGGRIVPGPNVGEYTAIALGSDGLPRISYYDVDNAALKYAVRYSDGGWFTETVDPGTPGGLRDVGQGTSIALTSAGIPAISYLALTQDDGGPSALRYALAASAFPTSATSWTVTEVQSSTAPCAGACTAAESCVDVPTPKTGGGCTVTAGTCVATASGCTGCAPSEACVLLVDAGVCEPVIGAASTGLVPIAVGLESSLIFAGANATIAYGDSLHGALMLAQQSGTTFTTAVVDGRDPTTCANTGSVGRFPSLHAGPSSDLAIAYQDETRGVLLYWIGSFGQSIAADQRIAIDNGNVQPPDAGEDFPQIVGANASLAFGPSGAAYVAYQDQTNISLRLASLPAGCTTAAPTACTPKLMQEWSTEAQGFFSSLGIETGKGFISNAVIQAGPTAETGQLLLEGPLSLP